MRTILNDDTADEEPAFEHIARCNQAADDASGARTRS
jgi:hypothetical protein